MSKKIQYTVYTKPNTHKAFETTAEFTAYVSTLLAQKEAFIIITKIA